MQLCNIHKYLIDKFKTKINILKGHKMRALSKTINGISCLIDTWMHCSIFHFFKAFDVPFHKVSLKKKLAYFIVFSI